MALASALDLRSPAESELPGSPVDKLAASLFGGHPPQHCIILPPDQTVGPKTKTQLMSERQVWDSLGTAPFWRTPLLLPRQRRCT